MMHICIPYHKISCRSSFWGKEIAAFTNYLITIYSVCGSPSIYTPPCNFAWKQLVTLNEGPICRGYYNSLISSNHFMEMCFHFNFAKIHFKLLSIRVVSCTWHKYSKCETKFKIPYNNFMLWIRYIARQVTETQSTKAHIGMVHVHKGNIHVTSSSQAVGSSSNICKCTVLVSDGWSRVNIPYNQYY